MSDNVAVTAGVGTTIAADEVTRNAISEKQQLIKIAVGTDGNYTGMVAETYPLPVGGTDALSIGKAEDAAHSTGHTGVFCMGVRRDTAAARTDTAGDYTEFSINSLGASYINIDSGFQLAAATGILKLEDAAHSSGDAGVMLLGVRADSDASGTGTDGDYGFIALDSLNRVKIAPGSGATSLGKLEDAAHTSGDLGVMMLGVRQDTAATIAGTAGDYTPPAINSVGGVKVDLDRTWQSSAANGLLKAEDAAHTSADAGAFILGVRDTSSTPMTSAEGDYAAFAVNPFGCTYIEYDFNKQNSGAAGMLKLEDAVAASGSAGIPPLAVRADTPLTNAGVNTDGDWANLSVSNDGALYSTNLTSTKGGQASYRNLDIDEAGVSIKASAGKVYSILFTNRTTSVRYLKLYNTAGTPTVGTDTPVITIPIQPAAASGVYTDQIHFEAGLNFSTGIGVGATTGFADADTGAPGANDVLITVGYK